MSDVIRTAAFFATFLAVGLIPWSVILWFITDAPFPLWSFVLVCSAIYAAEGAILGALRALVLNHVRR